jgi:4-hydroxythreonine-4-phosphate dehydrogenase/1,2-dihydroxy-3,5-cyclohexadiene-1,4-dicarboxylate dehydrogenase
MPAIAARPGEIEAAAGASAIDSATAAIRACQAGEFDAVVAGPHHETAIARAGIAFSGYPSLLARVCGEPEDRVFLLLAGGGLRIVHATLHERVATALARLDTALIVASTQAGLTFRRSRSQYGANFRSLCEGAKRLGRDAQQSE